MHKYWYLHVRTHMHACACAHTHTQLSEKTLHLSKARSYEKLGVRTNMTTSSTHQNLCIGLKTKQGTGPYKCLGILYIKFKKYIT